MPGERAHATAQTTPAAQLAASRKPATASSPLLAALQHGAGNAVVSRLVQRKEIGPHKGGKTWYSTGNFDAKHLITGSLDEDSAKARYTERYNKRPIPDGSQVNTVVAEGDLKTAITDATKVKGSYPPPRGPRGKLTVTVPGFKVYGKKTDGKQVPDRVAPVSEMTVEGTASETLYSPDHVAG
ncbi:MAG: hypothetical protein KJ048_15570 [Dehalococcoidia bacterium]|nr:hypothetical protein [Dehalococcoidia bacterium]